MGNPRSQQRWHQGRVFAFAICAALPIIALAARRDFTVTNGDNITITGGGGSRSITPNGITFRISAKKGVGVKFVDTKSGLDALVKGELNGLMVAGKTKGEQPRIDSVRTESPLTINKNGEKGKASVAGNAGSIKWTDSGYDATIAGAVVLTSQDAQKGQDFVAHGDRGVVSFEDKSEAKKPDPKVDVNDLDSILVATLTGNVRIDLKLAAVPSLKQDAGSYVATGDKMVLGPRGKTRNLTLTGHIEISGAGKQAGSVSGATKLILTINDKNEIIGEEIIGDEEAGTPISTAIPLKKKGGGRA